MFIRGSGLFLDFSKVVSIFYLIDARLSIDILYIFKVLLFAQKGGGLCG